MGKKTRDIAALAGLAGLAYVNRDKLFGSKSKDDAGDLKTSSYTGDTKKVEATDEPRRKIEDYQKKAPEDADEGYKSNVLKTVTAPKTASNAQAGNQGVLGGSTSSSKPKPRGMTGAQNDALATAGKKSKAASENNALAKVNRGMGREVTEAAKANAAPASSTSKVADTVKTVAKAAVQGPAASIATTAKPLADKATNAMRETYRDLSGKVQYKTPDIPSAAKTVSDAVASGAKKVGSGISDYVKNFETPAEARSRRDKEALGKKRGGMVNMASGGMTASRRGDGIAQRGKTRGKMC